MLKEEVRVSFGFKPLFLNSEVILFIIPEFKDKASLAVLSVVSAPIEMTTLSGASLVIALPVVYTVLFTSVISLLLFTETLPVEFWAIAVLNWKKKLMQRKKTSKKIVADGTALPRCLRVNGVRLSAIM